MRQLYMKFIWLTAGFMFVSSFVFSQDEAYIQNIPVGVFIPEQPNINSLTTSQLLETRLQSALALAGIGGANGTNDIIIYPIVNFVTEEVTAGAPTMYIQNQDITVFLSTWDRTKVFGAATLNLKGAGVSREKAFITAVRNLNIRDKELQKMLKAAKSKMAKYYRENCNVFLAEATALASQNQFGEAISLLGNYPSVNEQCFFECKEAAAKIFNQMEERACSEWIGKAEASLANRQFNKATYFLMQIPPNEKCAERVSDALTKLADVKEQIDERQWDFLLQIHRDKTMVESKKVEAIATVFAALIADKRAEDAQKIIINKFDLDD